MSNMSKCENIIKESLEFKIIYNSNLMYQNMMSNIIFKSIQEASVVYNCIKNLKASDLLIISKVLAKSNECFTHYEFGSKLLGSEINSMFHNDYSFIKFFMLNERLKNNLVNANIFKSLKSVKKNTPSEFLLFESDYDEFIKICDKNKVVIFYKIIGFVRGHNYIKVGLFTNVENVLQETLKCIQLVKIERTVLAD